MPNSRNAHRKFRREVEEIEGLNKSIDGVLCILSAVSYMVDGSVGVIGVNKKVVRFSLDTGEGFILIRRYALRYGLENHVDGAVTPPGLFEEK